ncbi:hypothetical protein HDU96_005601 [Phlyctochytrium bullatum]|nr:hypothetical protein HDU96_005601 [Phlyctochytrium bullatum]
MFKSAVAALAVLSLALGVTAQTNANAVVTVIRPASTTFTTGQQVTVTWSLNDQSYANSGFNIWWWFYPGNNTNLGRRFAPIGTGVRASALSYDTVVASDQTTGLYAVVIEVPGLPLVDTNNPQNLAYGPAVNIVNVPTLSVTRPAAVATDSLPPRTVSSTTTTTRLTTSSAVSTTSRAATISSTTSRAATTSAVETAATSAPVTTTTRSGAASVAASFVALAAPFLALVFAL